ncbi:MAG: hypothetical protein AAF674_11700 [Pseudomonadota bacterium]
MEEKIAQTTTAVSAGAMELDQRPGYLDPGSDLAAVRSVCAAVVIGAVMWLGIFRLIGIL